MTVCERNQKKTDGCRKINYSSKLQEVDCNRAIYHSLNSYHTQDIDGADEISAIKKIYFTFR